VVRKTSVEATDRIRAMNPEMIWIAAILFDRIIPERFVLASWVAFRQTFIARTLPDSRPALVLGH
jgi:hypothetical protein